MILEREVRTYRRELHRLVADGGKYVLIQGEQIIGIYSSRSEALVAGRARYDLNTPFLVKQIRARETPVSIPMARPSDASVHVAVAEPGRDRGDLREGQRP